MDNKPFTYEHFVQAIHSLKDDMLMYYIDEAVGIYCIQRGITVGPRPASARDYSPEYANAFEAANYAIYIVANKIGAYDSGKGAFRPYLHKALENALRDILKADGYGPSVNVDIENEPDTTASDAEERVRRHKDDAYETMVTFIDALPEIKRAAIYASAFGQILRPDLKGYGRNYADILAGIYHTTALYIRQLATEGKKAALAEARRQGFSESSMNEAYMGFQQAKSKDINDEVLKAVSQLEEYQQFMLLRHLAEKVDGNNKDNKGDIISTKVKTMSIWSDIHSISNGKKIRREDAEIYLINQLEDGKLKDGTKKVLQNTFEDEFRSFTRTLRCVKKIKVDEQAEQWFSDDNALALHACALLTFKFGGYSSLFDLLNRNGVEILIEPGIKYHSLPQKLAEAWDKKDVELWKAMPLRGEYIRKDNVIKLYPEEMHSEYNGERMDELLISTLAHEAMHAYFNRDDSRKEIPKVIPVEEPMAEFGMLIYLYETKLVSHYTWARADVAAKKTYYRYGCGLMLQHLLEADSGNTDQTPTRKDLESYKILLF